MEKEELPTYQQVEELLESVLNNKKLIKVPKLMLGPDRYEYEFLVLRHPTSEDIFQIRHVREKALMDALAEGLPTNEELKAQVEKSKIVPQVDKDRMKELEAQISAQRRTLQLTKIEGRRRPILDNIDRMQKELTEIKNKQSAYLYMSADTKADEEALLFQTWIATYTVGGEKRWKSFEDFEADPQNYFKSNLFDKFREFQIGLPVHIVRYLARHGLWLMRYRSALKIGGKLFAQELYELTPDQLALAYWSDHYQMIFEMMPDDRPDNDTIQDDEALDAYMERLFKEREADRKEGQLKRRAGSKGKKLDAFAQGHDVIITAAHPEYMNMEYTESRIAAPEGVTAVETGNNGTLKARDTTVFRKHKPR